MKKRNTKITEPPRDGIHWERWLDGRKMESGFRDATDIDDFYTREERTLHVSMPWGTWKKIHGS
jgi:hypothetical protein